ncbi:MAG: L,D-transpeptidase family protein, partial [Desulforhopalus sp.]
MDTENSCLTTIYEKTGGRPLWVNGNGPGAKATVIQHFLRSSYREGIDPGNYASERISSLFSATKPDDLALLDVLLTSNLARYIHDMRFGELEMSRLKPDCSMETGTGSFPVVEAVKAALAAPDIGAYLQSLVPDHTYYTKLRTALRVYRKMANNHSWQPIPPGPLIRPEDRDERLAEISRRLALINGEQNIAALPVRYTGKFVDKVKNFQHYHGLREDGIIGPLTLYWLNKTPQDLVNLICINMARWRHQAHDLAKTHIMVNIAGFSLKAVKNFQIELEMPVIVGDVEHKTAMFSDTIEYLDFNPFWNLPPSIARDEELPALRKNPRHLADRHIRVFSNWRSDGVELDPLVIDWKSVSRSQISRFKLRQDPGSWNALGRVKFVFPNHYSIYLHDTPLRKLFDYPVRDFSHGCIRVSQALDLALFC